MSDINKKIENLSRAIERLRQGISKFDKNDDLNRDGLIQRFEFTFELAWKTLKLLFEEEGVLSLNSPKLVLKEAYSADLIEEDEIWLMMLADRNSTSHIYSESMAVDICDRILNLYSNKFEDVLLRIRKRIL